MTRNESVKKWSRWKKFKNAESRENMYLTSKSWRDSFVEKQAVKAYYHSFNETAMKTLWKSNSGKVSSVVQNLESRLVTFLVTNHFAQSPFQAHQWIVHRHVRINDFIVTCPKYMLVPGDVITLDYLALEKNNNWLGRLSSTSIVCQRNHEGKNWVFDPKTNTIVYLGLNSYHSTFSTMTWERVKEFYIR